MDDRAAVIDRERTVVPNIFHIELSSHDYRRLAVFKDALCTELGTLVTDYSGEQRYTLLGAPVVSLGEDEELETGIFRVRSEARAEVTTQGGGSAVVVGQPRLEASGGTYPLVRAITRLGRGTDVDIRVEDPGASRNHCEIVLGSPIYLRDLDSTNGTFHNGEQITEVALVEGSVVQIGTTSLVFRSG
jgi:hypothetical protein